MPATAEGTSPGLPPEVAGLVAATDPTVQDRAWATFLEAHSRLLLHVARSVGHDYDAAMDGYAYLLEQLRRDDFHRLRTYHPDGSTRFTTWLVVVARRLCADLARRKYGRFRSRRSASVEHRAARRDLADLLVDELDDARLSAPDGADPARDLVAREESARLRSAIALLDTEDQLLLTLRFEDGRTLREIAPVLGLPTVLHVHRRLKRTFAALRAALTAPAKAEAGRVIPDRLRSVP